MLVDIHCMFKLRLVVPEIWWNLLSVNAKENKETGSDGSVENFSIFPFFHLSFFPFPCSNSFSICHVNRLSAFATTSVLKNWPVLLAQGPSIRLQRHLKRYVFFELLRRNLDWFCETLCDLMPPGNDFLVRICWLSHHRMTCCLGYGHECFLLDFFFNALVLATNPVCWVELFRGDSVFLHP